MNYSYKKVLLKISGESLLGDKNFGIDPFAAEKVALLIKELSSHSIQIAIVIGGGNIFRGIQGGHSLGIDRPRADHIGMLATLMNGIILQNALKNCGIPSRVISSLECPAIVETYNWERAIQYLENGDVIIFVGGTGNPFFTTDTASALKASEIGAQIFLKATTKVDGIYNKDPLKHPDAIQYKQISYTEFLAEQLKVLDYTAVALCMANQIPIKVFNLFSAPLIDTISDPNIGTLVI